MDILYYSTCVYLLIALICYFFIGLSVEKSAQRPVFWYGCVFWPAGLVIMIHFVITAKRMGGYPHD